MESGAPTPTGAPDSAATTPAKAEPSQAASGKRKRGKADPQEAIIVKQEQRSNDVESNSDSDEYAPSGKKKRAKLAPKPKGRATSVATRRSARTSRPLNDDYEGGQNIKDEPVSSEPEGLASLSPSVGEFREPGSQEYVDEGVYVEESVEGVYPDPSRL